MMVAGRFGTGPGEAERLEQGFQRAMIALADDRKAGFNQRRGGDALAGLVSGVGAGAVAIIDHLRAAGGGDVHQHGQPRSVSAREACHRPGGRDHAPGPVLAICAQHPCAPGQHVESGAAMDVAPGARGAKGKVFRAEGVDGKARTGRQRGDQIVRAVVAAIDPDGPSGQAGGHHDRQRRAGRCSAGSGEQLRSRQVAGAHDGNTRAGAKPRRVAGIAPFALSLRGGASYICAAMSGYAPFDGLMATAAALVVILSAIVSLVGSGARWRAVELGRARAQDLSELTGITDPRDLQDVFGPPDMGRVWRTVRAVDVRAARRPLGHLISNELVDWGCMAIAVLSFFWRPALMEIALVAAVVVQVTGWVVSTRLPR